MSLVQRVSDALDSVLLATEHYIVDASGIKPDAAMRAHVESWLKSHAPPAPMDDEAYLARIREGEGRFTAAFDMGIDPVRIARRLEIDEGFALAVKVAKAIALEPVLKVVRDKAIDSKDLKAALKLLEAQDHEEFGAKDKGPSVQVNIANVGSGDPVIDGIAHLRDELMQQKQVRGLAPIAEITAGDNAG